ncbi:hypothetical protein CCMSSC00406_0004007 [Pleurotus cornucopiae]|uniref:Uncharacterized protein n=1 Tax=Pleurotus cornucopiae TaxID=5321 RepID=A0ACB7IU05_PLECO|nr:hypothetical protein CCMSSC00406_0004007 [Pleurotus cornucopiae]
MTRITNFRYKRTHVDAGFSADADVEADPSSSSTSQITETPIQGPDSTTTTSHIPAEAEAEGSQSNPSAQPPPKKKRKRSKSKKNTDTAGVKENADAIVEGASAEGVVRVEGGAIATTPGAAVTTERTPRQKRRDREKWEKERRKQGTLYFITIFIAEPPPSLPFLTSTKRQLLSPRLAKEAKDAARKNTQPHRLKAIADRNSGTICFACRETGHAARDCPTTRNAAKGDSGAPGAVVGICYRCGSSTHTLSRCKERVDPGDPMPFASCFVCSGKGHLASGCPQNRERGVYPNGGCCKLCGKTMHLARDCDLHKKVDIATHRPILGIVDSAGAGADEDDFHALKRRKHEVDKEEKGTTHLAGATNANGALRKPKKVVNF